MDVIEIPTNKPIARIDHQDAVYKTHKEKINAIVDAVCAAHEKHQPVLVDAIDIVKSEEISGALRKKVLNTRY